MNKPSRKITKRKSNSRKSRSLGNVKRVGKIPTVRKAKYKVGDKVYTYENPQAKMPIIEVKAIIDDAPAVNVYRVLIPQSRGGFKKGNWISELSIYTVKR